MSAAVMPLSQHGDEDAAVTTRRWQGRCENTAVETRRCRCGGGNDAVETPRGVERPW